MTKRCGKRFRDMISRSGNASGGVGMALELDAFIEVAHRHSAAEAEGDLAGTLATLDSVPEYHFYPIAKRFVGMAATKRYYEHFFAHALPRIRAYELHTEWVGDVGVAQEYTVTVGHPDGTQSAHRVLGILTPGVVGLSGERIYADEAMLKILLGPVWNELEVI